MGVATAMNNGEHLWLVVNPASGSNDDDAVETLVGQFAEAGHTPAKVIDISTEPDLSARALDSAGVGLLAVFTGDGSLSSVLAQVEGWRGEVLVLPGGTTNLLAKALHGDEVTAQSVIADFLGGTLVATRRPVIAWSKGKAVCEILAGPGATWSDVREELRDGAVGKVVQAALEAARQTTGGALVRVIDPEAGKPDGYGGVRIVPEDDGLIVDGYGADSIAEYVQQGLALLKRDFREGPHDELGCHASLVCATVDGAPMDLMIDGERATGAPVETFSLASLAVNLLARRR